jgi:folate-binding protein YgfZ
MPNSITHQSPTAYEILRTFLGVGETGTEKEIITAQSLPFESNWDYLPAISFEKGCYLGQVGNTTTNYIDKLKIILIAGTYYENF